MSQLHKLHGVFLVLVSFILILLIITFDTLWHAGAPTGFGLLGVGLVILAAGVVHSHGAVIRRALLLRKLRHDLRRANVHFYL